MNSSYESKGIVRVEDMLNDYQIFNETSSDHINVAGNDTKFTEDYDVKTYLESILGPQRQPNEKLIPMTIIYVAMAITGIIGNVSVCWVIIRIPYMRSATNYYLFSLAVSDLLILLLGLPNDLHVFWQQYPWILGEALCKIRALISEMTSNSSVLTIVAFSLERYLAICHPYYSYTMSGLHRASKIIAAVWFLALVTAIPYAVCTEVLLQTNPITNEEIPESAFCTVNPSKTPSHLFESTFILFFLIPMFIMVILYTRMGFTIHKQHSSRNVAALGRQTSAFRGQRNTSGNTDRRPTQSKKAILKMLAAVVVAFFICWAPFHTQRLMYIAFYDYKWKFVNEATYHHINEKLYFVTGCFYYLSSTVNPILYNLLSVKYRNAFKEALCGVRNGDDITTYRSSLQQQQSVKSVNTSSTRHSRSPNNLATSNTNQFESNGQASASTRTNNGLLSIETIELETHSRNSSVSDAESRRVTFHACPCKHDTSCDVQGGGSCHCKKDVQKSFEG